MHRRRGVARAVRGGVALAALLGPVAAEACAGCIERAGLPPGFYWSAAVLTMLPFAAVAAAGVWLHRHVSERRTREARRDG